MSALTLKIDQPTGAVLTRLTAFVATATGDTAGLYFKWYSSLNAQATAEKPEIAAGQGEAGLNIPLAALVEFGTHVITLAASDRPTTSLEDIKKVTRAAMTGGAPGDATSPCVVHQLAGATFIQPLDSATSGIRPSVSRSTGAIKVLAPGAWLKPTDETLVDWVPNTDYQSLNGVGLALSFEPEVSAPEQGSATLHFTPAELRGLHCERVPGANAGAERFALTIASPLPAGLGDGPYQLLLKAKAGSTSAPSVVLLVTLIP